MSKRLQIVLPDPAAARLQHLAAAQGQPVATLASQMVRNEVALAKSDRTVRPLQSTRAAIGRAASERARWLEPYGDSPGWRAEMWGAIVALHGRYPRLLEALKDGWWTDAVDTEILCALAVWRGEIDDAAENPREELAFQRELAEFTCALRQRSGGASKAWIPGAPPRDWLGG